MDAAGRRPRRVLRARTRSAARDPDPRARDAPAAVDALAAAADDDELDAIECTVDRVNYEFPPAPAIRGEGGGGGGGGGGGAKRRRDGGDDADGRRRTRARERRRRAGACGSSCGSRRS